MAVGEGVVVPVPVGAVVGVDVQVGDEVHVGDGVCVGVGVRVGEGVAVCDPAAQGIRALLDGETGIVDDGGMIYAVAFRDLFPHDPGAVECGL